jgi:hypothetical protein
VTIVIFVVVTSAVLLIAAYAVGRTAERLAAEPPASLFEFDEAVEFVATALPEDLAARLSYGDVRSVIAAHLDILGRQEDAGEEIVFVNEHVRDLVAAHPDLAARSLGRADVDAVLSAEVAYLDAVGAVGGEVGPDDDDDPPRAALSDPEAEADS